MNIHMILLYVWLLLSDSGHKHLLLSFVKPHKEVKKSTISGWVKQVLKESKIFKAHSTRSASSSKVGTLGLQRVVTYQSGMK